MSTNIVRKNETRSCFTAAHDFAIWLQSKGAFGILIAFNGQGHTVSWSERTAG